MHSSIYRHATTKVTSLFAIAMAIMILPLAILASPPAPPQTVSYQGRLTNSSDSPVADGPYAFHFGLWTDSVQGMGTEVWSENQDLSVKSGLFSAQLGRISSFFDVFADFAATGSPLFLETKVMVGGSQQTLLPRLRIGSAPYARVAGSVHGDISTAPDMMVVGDSTTGAFAKVHAGLHAAGGALASGKSRISLDCDDSQSSIAIGDPGVNGRLITSTSDDNSAGIAIDESGVHRALMSTNDDTSHLSLKTYQPGQPTYGNITFDATGDGARRISSFFDVFTEVSLDENVDSSGALSRWKGGMSGSTTGTIRMQATPDSAVFIQEHDSDGNGIADFSAGGTVDDTSSQWSASKPAAGPGNHRDGWNVMVTGNSTRETLKTYFETGDIPTQEQVVNASGSLFRAINTKGTGAVARTSMEASDSASVQVESDVDGDGVPDFGVSSSCDNTSSQQVVYKKGLNAVNVKLARTISSTPGGLVALDALDMDSDDDGVMDRSVSSSCDATGARSILKGGMSGSTTGTIRMKATPDSAVSVLESDVDGDGVPESSFREAAHPKLAEAVLKGRSGSTTGTIRMQATPDSTVSILEADLDGDGTMDRQVSSTVDSGQAGIAIDEPGVQVAMGFRKGWDGTIKGRLTIDEGMTPMIEMNSAGDGYLNGHLGIGMSATHRIDVAGGAYCDGTNWVNASDRNSKENFVAVDGSELLAKIDELPITRWNYKNDHTASDHIGPTAQDFHALFGVGNDSISISTIDPSGIALAAIKELSKRTGELDQKTARIAELETQLNELKTMVAKLMAEQEKK